MKLALYLFKNALLKTKTTPHYQPSSTCAPRKEGEDASELEKAGDGGSMWCKPQSMSINAKGNKRKVD